jgi:hypothetical protein
LNSKNKGTPFRESVTEQSYAYFCLWIDGVPEPGHEREEKISHWIEMIEREEAFDSTWSRQSITNQESSCPARHHGERDSTRQIVGYPVLQTGM